MSAIGRLQSSVSLFKPNSPWNSITPWPQQWPVRWVGLYLLYRCGVLDLQCLCSFSSGLERRLDAYEAFPAIFPSEYWSTEELVESCVSSVLVHVCKSDALEKFQTKGGHSITNIQCCVSIIYFGMLRLNNMPETYDSTIIMLYLYAAVWVVLTRTRLDCSFYTL